MRRDRGRGEEGRGKRDWEGEVRGKEEAEGWEREEKRKRRMDGRK